MRINSLFLAVFLVACTDSTEPVIRVVSVTVSLQSTELMVGQTTQASVTTRDAAGVELNGRNVTWSTGQPALATVSATGLVTALTMGSTTVIGTSEKQSGSVALAIVPPLALGGGTKVIGRDIGSGMFRSNNPLSANCYWERLRGLGGTQAEVIAKDGGPGPAVVVIAGNDRGFGSTGCATWTKVAGDPITTNKTAPFGAGSFIVGTDIAGGTWRSDAVGSECYWARVRAFSGLLDDILNNYFGTSPVTVTISGTDAGFLSRRCGTWTKIG